MHIVMGKDANGSQLVLWDYLKSRGDDRHHLLVIRNPRKDSRAYLPHQLVIDGANTVVAGEIVLKWLNQPGRTAAELVAARSFFGWDITSLTPNQQQFIADAEEAGLTVDFNYVPENSFGRNCPAVELKGYYNFLKSTLLVEMTNPGPEFWVFARD